MDFFSHQDRARRNTRRLILLYILAVALIIGSVYLVISALLFTAQNNKAAGSFVWWQPELFIGTTIATIFIVLIGTIYKTAQLARGGAAVAELLGGRRIPPDTTDLDERKILNVTEEMAIAAGLPVPPVFLLENETGINAFAAGFSPRDAVIGVTSGAIKNLSRDELQGVIAHEFSHILNGDMRLNIRLMGVLHGILLIAMIGYWLMRSSASSGSRTSSRRSKGKGQGQIILLGLGLMLIGYIGVFFAKLIKSAVSRQREFLADASAVQFTRNPGGIAGALKKIADYVAGSRLAAVHAEETSHFFFANGLAEAWFGLFSTHPPLAERIRRIDTSATLAAAEPASAAPSTPSPERAKKIVITPQTALASIGVIQAHQLAYTRQMLDAIPALLREAVRTADGAQAVIFGLLISGAAGASEALNASALWQILEQKTSPALLQKTRALATAIAALKPETRLPLADMAVAGLKAMPPDYYHRFRETLDHLITADRKVDLFEYMLYRMVLRHLAPHFEKLKEPPERYRQIGEVLDACRDLLACLAYYSAPDDTVAARYYAAGLERLGARSAPETPPMRRRAECGTAIMDAALETLAQSSLAVKKSVVEACLSCVLADNAISVAEAQVLRAVSDYLGCPLPPMAAQIAA